ncbi:probable replication factor C subunit 1 [Uloborus diversus]|uniref:probable replication factor C subunit 1 n=1 Tax=Uloborus diversus TaxID=327109 RepID=UPI00240936CA|nr:probable replication factor C subunit 1 [Uloborus diversus]
MNLPPKVNSAKSFLLLNSKRQSLPSRASDVKKIASFGTKRKSLDFSDSSARKSLRRRVTFGPRLSPEEFDKRLPPASPLRRGSLPNRKRSILNSAKHKITAAPEDKRFKHCKAMKLKFSPKCSTSLVATPVNDKNSSEDSEEKVPSVAKRLLFSEVLKKPIPVDDLFQKPAPSGNKPKVLNVPADKCVKKLEKSSTGKEVNMECSSRADCDGNLNLDEPKLKSPMNVSFLGNETVESTRRRRKSSVAKQLIATAKTAIRQSKLLTIKDTPSSEVAGEDLKISKGRRRRVRAAVTPKASSTKSRKRANSLVKKDATSDRAVKKIALDDDPEKSLKNSDGTPAKSKLNTPAKSKGQPTVKSVELTDTRTPIKRRNLRKRNIEVESSSSTKKQSVGEAPDIKLMSPNSKTVKKSPSKLVAGRRTRAKPKRESLKPKDVPVELKSPVKKRSTKKNEGIKEVSSSTKAVEGTPSKSRTGKRKRASATTSSKRRNLKSKDAPIVLNSPVENSNDDSTKKAKVAKLPSKTKGVRKRPSTGKDSMPQKRVSPKRVSPEKRITRSIRRKISGEKKN